jgi:hypothetical protein
VVEAGLEQAKETEAAFRTRVCQAGNFLAVLFAVLQ